MIVYSGKLNMFRADAVSSLVISSLNWETMEQYFFWQLVTAHNVNIKVILSNITKLDFNNHAEILTNIMLMLKKEK